MSVKNYKKNLLNFIIIPALIFTLDRSSKLYVIYLSNKYKETEIFFSKFLNISLIWNEGVAFGLFAFSNVYYYHFITGIVAIVIIFVFFFAIKSHGVEKYSFMMILGGSIGNIFDRLYYFAVPDFIDIHFYNFHWFIFNVADIFISVGVILLICNEIFKKHES